MIAVIIISVLMIAALVGLFVPYYIVFFSPHRNADEIEIKPFLDDMEMFNRIKAQAKKLSKIPCDLIRTTSYDGLKLWGRYYHQSDDAPLCICFHGYRGSAVFDFSIMGQFLLNEGYNVLLVDQRAHFRSGGHTITYGIRERRDVLSWIEYANDRFGSDKPIYLFGISMGATTVVMSSGLSLPDNIKLICADCPFSSPGDVIYYVAKRWYKFPKLLWALIRISALVYGHLIIPRGITAANAVKNTQKPVLLIHGEADCFVPKEMSEEIRLSNPERIERHTFPGAVHGMSYFADTERYIAIVRNFIKRNGI